MKKTLIYALALALTLSLTACSQPKAEQPTDLAPSTSAPEPIVAPEPIKDTTPAPEPNEIKELSGTELLEYFQKVYDIHQEIHIATTLDGLINEELEFLVDLVESDGYTLPSDYEAQYRAWRPTDSLPADIQNQQEQQVNSTQQSTEQTQTQKSSTGQTQTQKPSSDTQQNQPTQKPSSSNQTQQQQPSQPSVGPDIYQGYGSYEALIDAACKELPELSREEIMDRIPDLSKTYVDWEQAAREAEEGLLNMGG